VSVCAGAIDVDEDDVDEGDTLSCDECGADLRVSGTDPLNWNRRKTSMKTRTTKKLFWKKTKRRTSLKGIGNRSLTMPPGDQTDRRAARTGAAGEPCDCVLAAIALACLLWAAPAYSQSKKKNEQNNAACRASSPPPTTCR